MTAPRTISDAYKAQAVARVEAGDSVASVAKAYGVARSSLTRWIAELDDIEYRGGWVQDGLIRRPFMPIRDRSDSFGGAA